MVPQHDDPHTRVALNDLCRLLTRAVGTDVVPHRAPSPEALASAVKGGRVQVAWVSPTLLLLSDHLRDTVPLLSSIREGVRVYHSVIFVRADSALRTVEQVRGARVAWVSKTSASGYIVPRSSLAQRGIVLRDAFREDLFLGSHAAVSRAVVTRQVDVGATYAVFERGEIGGRIVKAGFLDDAGSPPPIHILDTSGPVPSDFIIAAASVSVNVRSTMASALERLCEDQAGGPAIQHLMGADRFTRFSPAALADLRELVKVGRDLGALEGL